MSFIDNVTGNMLSGVICSPSFGIPDILRLVGGCYNRVWFGARNKFGAENILGLMEESNVTVTNSASFKSKNPGIVISSASILCDKLLSSFHEDNIEDITFSDVLVVDGVTSGSLDTVTIIALWKRSYSSSRGVKLPRMVLVLDSMEIPENIPLDIPYTHKSDSIPKITYTERDIISTIKSRNSTDDVSHDYIVYCKDQETCMAFAKALSRVGSKIYQLGNNSQRSKFSEVNAANTDKRKIIITSEDIVYHRSSIIFDQLIYKVKGETNLISKTLADMRTIYAHECIRFCTNSEFDLEVAVHSTPMYKICPIIDKLAMIYEAKIDPLDLLSGFIEDDIINEGARKLKKNRMISNSNSVLKAGSLFLKLPLSHQPSAIIHRAMERNHPVFPFIVLSTFIEMGETEFYTVRPKMDKSLLELNLMFWTKYANEVGTLKPAKSILSMWCKTTLLDVDAVSMLCKTIITCLNQIEIMHQKNYMIGKFSTENLFSIAKPIIHEIYDDDIYMLSGDNSHYVDSSDRKFLPPDNLDKLHHRIIGLTKTHDKITSFIPDDSIFSDYTPRSLATPTLLGKFLDTSDLPFEVISMIGTVFENNVTQNMNKGSDAEEAVDMSIRAVDRILNSQFRDTESREIKNIMNNARESIILELTRRDEYESEDEDDDEMPPLQEYLSESN